MEFKVYVEKLISKSLITVPCKKGLDGVYMGCPGGWDCAGGQCGVRGGSEKVSWRS